MNYNKLEQKWLTEWFKFIKEHPDKDWDWDIISQNPNITWDIIQNNLDKNWDFEGIFHNQKRMNILKYEWINNQRLHIIKANIIKRYWRRCSYDPSYKLGYKLVLQRVQYGQK